MTYRQALREILSLGFVIHATTSYPDGVAYEARKGKVVVRGEKCYTPDDAMANLYRVVLGKEHA
jgi:hypothetical protein